MSTRNKLNQWFQKRFHVRLAKSAITKLAVTGALGAYAAAGIAPDAGGSFKDGVYAVDGVVLASFNDMMTVTESTAGTTIDSDGVLKRGAHNLLTGSTPNSTWTKSEMTITEDVSSGGQTWSRLVPSATASAIHYAFKAATSGTNKRYLKLYVKFETGSAIDKLTFYPGSANTFAHINLTTQAWVNEANVTSSAITDLGDDEYMIEVVWPNTITTNTVRIYAGSGTYGSNASTENGTDGILVRAVRFIENDLDMQDNPDDATGGLDPQYVPTTTAAVYKRRYSWASGSKKLLWEPQRTNLEPNSNTIYTDWTDAGTGVTEGTVSPDGVNNWCIFNTDGTGGQRIYGSSTSVGIGETIVASIFVDANQSTDGTHTRLYAGYPSGERVNVDITVASGVVTLGTPYNSSSTIWDVGFEVDPVEVWPGIWRISVAAENISGVAQTANSGMGIWEVTSTTAALAIWGAFLEIGTVPTNFFPTYGSTVTRNAPTFTVPYGNLPNVQYPVDVTGTLNTTQTWATAASYDNTTSGTGTTVTATAGTTLSRSYITMTGLTAGSTYELWVKTDSVSSGNIQAYVKDGTNPNAGTLLGSDTTANTPKRFVVTALTSNAVVLLQSSTTAVSFTATVKFKEVSRDYIGSTLVTNGTFDTDTTGWSNDGTSTIAWNSGVLDVSRNSSTVNSGRSCAQQVLTGLTIGAVYEVKVQLTAVSHGGSVDIFIDPTFALVALLTDGVSFTSPGWISKVFIATATSHGLGLGARDNPSATASFDNVSVREINPLAVSFNMKLAATYADNGTLEFTFVRHYIDASNNISCGLYTSGAETGEVNWFQYQSGNSAQAVSSNTAYSPGTLVPISIASRHLSTLIQGAYDGTATSTASATNLVDLSATDLILCYSGSGPMEVEEFWMWKSNITQTGLEQGSTP